MNVIKVADEYRLKDRNKGVYNKNGTKQCTRKGMKVEQSYIDEVNKNTGISGKMMVIDEEASAKFDEYKPVHEQQLKDNAKAVKLGATKELANLLNSNSGGDSGGNETNVQDPELIEKHKELFNGKAPMANMKNENLKKKIDAKLAE